MDLFELDSANGLHYTRARVYTVHQPDSMGDVESGIPNQRSDQGGDTCSLWHSLHCFFANPAQIVENKLK
jgi:hypothetical protein